MLTFDDDKEIHALHESIERSCDEEKAKEIGERICKLLMGEYRTAGVNDGTLLKAVSAVTALLVFDIQDRSDRINGDKVLLVSTGISSSFLHLFKKEAERIVAAALESIV